MPVRYPDDEMLKEAIWRDRQKISILVELIASQKNVANALNSIGITSWFLQLQCVATLIPLTFESFVNSSHPSW